MDTTARLRSALENARLVTVVGPPGIGKSRVAERACPADGLLVLCDGVGDAFDLEQRVAAELELAPGFQPPTTWLLLDGLMADVADLLGRWLDQGARLLVTRETPLGLDAETVVEVPPLTVDQGVQFIRQLVDRPLWASTPRQKRALRTLVEQLGGRPGLLRLVAARAEVAQPSELLAVSSSLVADAPGLDSALAALSPQSRRALHVLVGVQCPVRPNFLERAFGPDWGELVAELRQHGWLGLGAGGLVVTALTRDFLAGQTAPDGLPDIDALLVAHLRAHPAEVEHYASHLRRSQSADAVLLVVEWLALVDSVAAARLLREMGALAADPRLSSFGAVVARNPDELAGFLAHEHGVDTDVRSAFRFRLARARAGVLFSHNLDDRVWVQLDDDARELGLVVERVRLLHLVTHLFGMRVEVLRARRAFDAWLELAQTVDHPLPALLARASRAHFSVDVGDAGARDELAACAKALRGRGLLVRATHYAAMLAYDALGTDPTEDVCARLGALRDRLLELGDRHFSTQVDTFRLSAEVEAGTVDRRELRALAEDQAAGGTARHVLTARILMVASDALNGDREGLLEAARAIRDLNAIPPQRAILPAVDALAEGRPYSGPPPRAIFERQLIRWANRAASPALRVDARGFGSVDLGRRHVQRRLWTSLLDARRDQPGTCLSAEALVDAVWPDERMAWSSARNRLYVALSHLRKAGLGPVLQSQEGGWRLDPAIRLESRQGFKTT